MTKKFYHYTECGLDDVFLLNGYSIDSDGVLFIKNIQGLHKAIAERLIFVPRKLKNKEVRFIRHYLDVSQKVFGEMLGVDYQSILRWETGKTKITKTAERFLRSIFYEYVNGNVRAVDIIDRLSDLDNNRQDTRIEFLHKLDKWETAA